MEDIKIPKSVIFGLLAILLNVVYVGMPLWLYDDVCAQVEKKASKESIEIRLKNLEKTVEKIDTSMEKNQRTIDRLGWWLEQQMPDTLRHKEKK